MTNAIPLITGLTLLLGCNRFYVGTGRSNVGTSYKLALVRTFVQRLGRSSDARLLKLFSNSARIEVVGLGIVAQGENKLQDFFGYARTVNSCLEMFDGRVSGDTVFCRLQEKNDWLRIMGIESVGYQARFVLDSRKIVELVIEPDGVTRNILMGQGIAFWRWLRSEEPKAIETLLPDGKFRFTPENGKMLVRLVARWRGGY